MAHAPLNTINTYLDAILRHGVDHAPTHKWKASPFFLPFFCSTDKIDTKIRKNTKATVTPLEKKRVKRAHFPFVCMCRANTRLNFLVETRKFERGIAERHKMIVITCILYGNRVFGDISRLVAISLGLISVFSQGFQLCLHQFSP